jgi:mannose-6-phosphate isomerase class I
MEWFGNYDKYPEKAISGYQGYHGWADIAAALKAAANGYADAIFVLDYYPGIDAAEIRAGLEGTLCARWFDAEACAISDNEYNRLIKPFVTEDRVFGIMNTLRMEDIYDNGKIAVMRNEIEKTAGLRVVAGVGAALITRWDILVYFDLARWEIQKRFAKGAVNWKTANTNAHKLAKFKQGFFVEWRIADRHKKTLLNDIDFLVDTNQHGRPNAVSGEGFRKGLERFTNEPFRTAPYFAPEVWGGQWMKDICALDKDSPNYAWAFDGVPEENSICMRFGGVRIEVPSVDALFYNPRSLLGERVHARFGDEFPIRFDFLDTMGGQNLSLQVHPFTEYIQNTFGMHYTQDESYYILDCEAGSEVYLGLTEGINPGEMIADLKEAQSGKKVFDDRKYVNRFPCKKHDHFLIPAGTVHCSGKNTMVLEISATPYIFTFKLWDWGRLGLDGLPRPVHINHGEKVIAWDRTTEWVRKNLVNRFVELPANGGRVERTGLHEREFIETVRYTVSDRAVVPRQDSVSVCNVVAGKGAVIESPDNVFLPFEVHYAETFIVPAASGTFSIRPLNGEKEVMVISAQVKG